MTNPPDCCLLQEGPILTSDMDATSAITLVIATSPDYWPMEYISGTQIVGHDIDLMNAIAAEMGVTAVYTERAFGDLLTGLVAADYDAIISSLTVTSEREEVIDFTLPYVTLGDGQELAIAVQQGDEALRQQINDALRQLQADGVLQAIVAAIAEDQPEWQPRLPDWTSGPITLSVATSPDYWPMEYISATQIVGHDIDLMNAIAAEMGVTVVYTERAFGDLLTGLVAAEYDAIISSLTVTSEREEVIDFTLPYVTLGDGQELAIAVQQGDEALRQQINDALQQLRADGVLEAIIVAIAEDQPEWQPRLPDWTSATLTIGTTSELTCLDPADAASAHAWEVLESIASGLLRYEAGSSELKASLATALPQVGPDGQVYTFTLRSGLEFPDGTPLDADAVKWSIDRVADLGGDASWYVTAFVSETQVVDSTTVRFILQEPNSAFPHLVATPAYFPVNPNCFPADQIDPLSICGGIGPYHVASWDQGISLYLEADPTYDGPPPKTPSVAVRYFDSAETLRQALEDGDIDVAWRTLEPSETQELGNDPNYEIVKSNSSFIRYLCFHTTSPAFDNAGVRTALAAAVDREPIALEVYSDTMSALYSMVPAGMWSHRDSFFDLYGSRNLTATRTLLQLAGYSEANKLKMDLWYPLAHYGSEEPDLAARLAADLEESGMISVSLHSADWSTYVGKLGEGTMPAFLLGWYPDHLDPESYTWPFAHSSSSPGMGTFYDNPVMDSLLEAGRTTTPIQGPAREAIYADIQDLWAEEAPTIPLLQGSHMAIARNGVHNVLISLQGILAYSMIWREPVADIALTLRDDPDPVLVGGALTYTIAVVNDGPDEATGVILTDTLPGNAIFVWASPGCTQAGGVVTCELGPLAAGEWATFTIRVTTDAVGQLISLADVTAQEMDPDPTNNAQVEYTVVSVAPVLGPIPSGIRPADGVNDALTPITIDGTNFQEGATASLGGTPLQAVSVVSKQRLLAVVPSALPPGTHDLTVTNPDARSGKLPKAFSVLTPDPPTLTSVKPAQGPNDLPVTVEIEGANLSPEVEASLNLGEAAVPMEGLIFLDTTRLLASVPVSTTGGLYSLTVTNPGEKSDLLADAYRALEPAENNDLHAEERDLWLDPPSIHEGDAVTIGLTLRRQGGQADLQDVEVHFYLEGGTPAFAATAPLLAPRGQVTVTVDWTPPPSQGDYTLYAEIDPLNVFPEDNEENNLVGRLVTILPPVPDTIPPTVHKLTIDDGALYNPDHYVELYVEASDAPGGTGVAYLLFVEYLFVQSERDWVPVAMSEWLPYHQWYRRGWALSVQPGAHYFQVWAADGAGNISPVPGSQMVNWNPSTSVSYRAVHVYRQPAEAGQQFWMSGVAYSGAVEIRIFDPSGGLLRRRIVGARNRFGADWSAALRGTYQVEVWGYTPSANGYEILGVGVLGSASTEAVRAAEPEEGEVTPVIPPGYVPGRHLGVPSPVSAGHFVYLPLVVRGSGP